MSARHCGTWTEAEEKFLQSFVDKTRQQFVRAVADGRKMPIAQVESLADGRIFTGEEAKENGLVRPPGESGRRH